jgi:hypothetical protein
MSQIEEIKKDLESKASKLAQDIQQSLANHNYLLGQADAVKTLIEWASKAIDVYPVSEQSDKAVEIVDESINLKKD